MGQKIKSGQYFAALRANRDNPTAALVLEDGSVFTGYGFGAATTNVGEICFNTSMTGYQEILTDPSYAGQIITFTFPHIGNVGANDQDFESIAPAALGLIVRQAVTNPASWRATSDLDSWLKTNNLPGISGIDTRALTRRIRDLGAPRGALCYAPDGNIDIDALKAQAAAWPGLKNMDLAVDVTCDNPHDWHQGSWQMDKSAHLETPSKYKVVAMDFGCKLNILRSLEDAGCAVHVVPANATADEIMALQPEGVFLSNGPGDPEPCDYAIQAVEQIIAAGIPVFGICLGHQILSLASGAKTMKMKTGHHGANHPVGDQHGQRVFITSQNHGFAVDDSALPDTLAVTHRSLFDNTVQGVRRTDVPAFGFQGHPEASPGPHDIIALFDQFIADMEAA